MRVALGLLLAGAIAVSVAAQTRPRGRDLGIPFPGRTGVNNAITDVAGVAVGHVTLVEGEGRLVAGFAAFKDHLSYLPFSGSVLPELASELEGYTMTKSALHCSIDRPLPKTLVRNLIAARPSKSPRSQPDGRDRVGCTNSSVRSMNTGACAC